MRISGRVSLKTTGTLLGRNVGKAGSIVPNIEDFRVGDVILHRDPRTVFGRSATISSFQRRRGHTVEAATWSHVSMYVGSGMIAESRPSLWRLRTGLRIDNLIRRSVGTEILILRSKKMDDASRFRAAHFLLILNASRTVPYGFGRLFKEASRLRVDFLPDGAVCSELILQSLVYGAYLLVEEYMLSSMQERVFLPADFFENNSFDKIEPGYLELTD